jgi:hypothetical protein
MLSSSGLNTSVLLGIAFSTCLKSVGPLITNWFRVLRGPLYAFNFLLTEKLPRLDARDAKLLLRLTHSRLLVDGLSCGSGIGGGTKRG